MQARVGAESSQAGENLASASPVCKGLWSWNASAVVTAGFYLKVGEREMSDAFDKGGITAW